MIANHIPNKELSLPDKLLQSAAWLKKNYISYLETSVAHEEKTPVTSTQKNKLITQIKFIKETLFNPWLSEKWYEAQKRITPQLRFQLE